jgi:hypothetical protein
MFTISDKSMNSRISRRAILQETSEAEKFNLNTPVNVSDSVKFHCHTAKSSSNDLVQVDWAFVSCLWAFINVDPSELWLGAVDCMWLAIV